METLSASACIVLVIVIAINVPWASVGKWWDTFTKPAVPTPVVYQVQIVDCEHAIPGTTCLTVAKAKAVEPKSTDPEEYLDLGIFEVQPDPKRMAAITSLSKSKAMLADRKTLTWNEAKAIYRAHPELRPK